MYIVNCPNCGEYSIEGLETLIIPTLTSEEKTRLRAVVKEHSIQNTPAIIKSQRTISQHVAGHPISKTIAGLLTEYPTTSDDTMNRAMLNLGRLPEHPFDEIHLGSSDQYLLLFASDPTDLLETIKRFQSIGLLTSAGNTVDEACVKISPQGWAKIKELKHHGHA